MYIDRGIKTAIEKSLKSAIEHALGEPFDVNKFDLVRFGTFFVVIAFVTVCFSGRSPGWAVDPSFGAVDVEIARQCVAIILCCFESMVRLFFVFGFEL